MMSDAPEPWSLSEIDPLIDSYVWMLNQELSGIPFNKRRTNSSIQQLVPRSHASIEFKLGNLSAVLDELGRPYIDGYKPRRNYQELLGARVRERLHEFPEGPKEEITSQRGNEIRSVPTDAPASQVPGAFPAQGAQSRETQSQESVEKAFWDRVGRLWSRATGGGDVAARPADSIPETLPIAPSPAGVDEACKWYSEGLAETEIPRILLLIGGPGAGKSHATRSLVQSLLPQSEQDPNLAHRRYDYSIGDRRLLLINDASIPEPGRGLGSLVEEINEAIETSSHFVACVNRGILVEEEKMAGGQPRVDAAGAAILTWLQRGAEHGDRRSWHVSTEANEQYFRAGLLQNEDQFEAEIVAVFVDVCSLLEQRPTVEFPSQESGFAEAEKYSVGEFASRRGWHSRALPAGDLLEQVIDYLRLAGSVAGADSNPVLANVESLGSPLVRSSVLSVLRAAEITSGQRFTYREVWGAIVRLVAGTLPEECDSLSVEQFLDTKAELPSDAIGKFQGLRYLANHRFSQALFVTAHTGNGGRHDSRSNPVTRTTADVDPMRDTVPGVLTSSPETGWASPVMDAFAGPSDDVSPLMNLKENLADSDLFHTAVTSFEASLDEAFVAAIRDASLRDKDRIDFVNWYGSYLGRLYAVANGVPAFHREVALWTDAWAASQDLPPDLDAGLRTLLRPKRRPNQPDSASLIPILDSRTNPIVGSQADPKLALLTGDVDMKSRREGESLFLIVSQHGQEIAQMPLDFALVREAAVSVEGHPGITELTDTTSPRLERFRAARLVPDKLRGASYRIVVREQDVLINPNKES